MNATNLPTVRSKPPAAPPMPAIPETPSEPIVMRAYVGETGSSPTPAANALQAESGREPVGGRGVRVGLGLRLFLGFFVVVFLGAGISSVLIDRNVQASAHAQVTERLTYEVIMLGQMTANALFGPIDPGDTSLEGVVKQLAASVHTNLSILAPDGTVVADSDAVDLSKLANQASAPEVVAALGSGARLGVSVRAVSGVLRLLVAEPILRDGKVLGVARASVPMAVVDAAARAARLQMAYGGLVATGIAMAVAAMIALGILRPVRALVLGANRIGAGELSHRIEVRSNDEIGDLGHALNEMVRRLQRMVGTLDQRNHDMRVVLDNVGQGLVTVDRDGRIADERSRAIDAWFGTPKSGTKLWDLFPAAPPAVRDGLSIGWAQLFDGVLPLELLLRQLPGRIKSGDLHYEIGYEPILSASGDLSKCLIVVSDVTATVEAEQTEVEQREQLSLFAAVAKDREGLAEFVKETGALVAYVFDSGENPSTAVLVKRAIHTIKGNSGLFGLTSLSTLCHDIETRAAERELDGESDVLPLPADRHALQDAWGRLTRRAHDLLGNSPPGCLEVTPKDVGELVVAIQQRRSPDVLIRAIATWALEPVGRRLARLAEQTRQLAARMGKGGLTVDVAPSTVRFPAEGWAPFWANLSHVVRNALDHGIESPEDRTRAGKPEHGRLQLSATEVGDCVVVDIADDGRGIDWVKLRQRALAAGLPSETDADLVNALFRDGVSTREQATEYSGRGVGLGAVRGVCETMKGRIEVQSSPGVGTRFRFHFPLPGVDEVVAKLSSAVSLPSRTHVPSARMSAVTVPRMQAVVLR